MKLINLRLLNFKNHLDSSWQFNTRVNCFVGDNGVGKTNILDAIHYLSITKSYFSSNDSVSINFNSDFFTVKGSFSKNEISSVLSDEMYRWVNIDKNFNDVFNETRQGKSLWKIFLLIALILFLLETWIGRPTSNNIKH